MTAEARHRRSMKLMSSDHPDEVDVDGLIIADGVECMGKATRQPTGEWISLAKIGYWPYQALARVELTLTFGAKEHE
jgi:hypothetical protein